MKKFNKVFAVIIVILLAVAIYMFAVPPAHAEEAAPSAPPSEYMPTPPERIEDAGGEAPTHEEVMERHMEESLKEIREREQEILFVEHERIVNEAYPNSAPTFYPVNNEVTPTIPVVVPTASSISSDGTPTQSRPSLPKAGV